MDRTEQQSQDIEEAAIAFGNLSALVALPTKLSGRSLSPCIVRSSIAERTIFDPDVLEVASILNTKGESE